MARAYACALISFSVVFACFVNSSAVSSSVNSSAVSSTVSSSAVSSSVNSSAVSSSVNSSAVSSSVISSAVSSSVNSSAAWGKRSSPSGFTLGDGIGLANLIKDGVALLMGFQNAGNSTNKAAQPLLEVVQAMAPTKVGPDSDNLEYSLDDFFVEATEFVRAFAPPA